MKLWKKKVKEFGKDFEQSEEFEKNEEIGDAEEFETEEPGKEPKVLGIRIPFRMRRIVCRTPRIPGMPIKMRMPTTRPSSWPTNPPALSIPLPDGKSWIFSISSMRSRARLSC